MNYLANIYGLDFAINDVDTPYDAARIAADKALHQGCFDVMDRIVWCDVWQPRRGENPDDFIGSFRVEIHIKEIEYTVTKEGEES